MESEERNRTVDDTKKRLKDMRASHSESTGGYQSICNWPYVVANSANEQGFKKRIRGRNGDTIRT